MKFLEDIVSNIGRITGKMIEILEEEKWKSQCCRILADSSLVLQGQVKRCRLVENNGNQKLKNNLKFWKKIKEIPVKKEFPVESQCCRILADSSLVLGFR